MLRRPKHSKIEVVAFEEEEEEEDGPNFNADMILARLLMDPPSK